MTVSNPGSPVTRADLRNPDLTVEEVMRSDFRSCNASTPATEAASALRAGRCSYLTVTRAQIPIGIVSERGLALALADRGGDLSGLKASDVMTETVATVPLKARIAEAIDKLVEAGGFLPVVNTDGLLKGILTPAELRTQLSESALGRLAARFWQSGEMTGRLDPHPVAQATLARETPAEAVRAADHTAEILSSKSQAQAHPWDSPTGAHPEPVPLVTPADLVNPLVKVADAMNARPRTCSPESTIREAVRIFRDADCGFIPVTSASRPVGVITDRDVALALLDHETDLLQKTVSDLPMAEPITIEPQAPLELALRRLGDQGVRRLLVIDSDGLLVGVLGWTDLIPHVSERGLGQVLSRIARHG